MIVIIDYGAGNLFSVKNAFDFLGIETVISDDRRVIERADKLILPGVGSFPDAMTKLSSLVESIKFAAGNGTPLLGICLGMQILFDKGYEFGETAGLGLIKGDVCYMDNDKLLTVPHMGWNSLNKNRECGLSQSINEGQYVYFVHSYMAMCSSANVAAYCDYGGKVPAMVFEKSVYGCQFHPEKSGARGLNILKKFADL